MNDLDCFFLCQGYYRWSASKGEGPTGYLLHTVTFLVACNMLENLTCG